MKIQKIGFILLAFALAPSLFADVAFPAKLAKLKCGEKYRASLAKPDSLSGLATPVVISLSWSKGNDVFQIISPVETFWKMTDDGSQTEYTVATTGSSGFKSIQLIEKKATPGGFGEIELVVDKKDTFNCEIK